MKDWTTKLNSFLQFNEREILENADQISKVVADEIAGQEYGKFNKHRIERHIKMTLMNSLITIS